MRRLGVTFFLALMAGAASPPALAQPAPQSFPTPLPEESLPSVATLPAHYPPSWVLVHDMNMASLIDGKVAVVDTASADRPLKGTVRASQFAFYLYSAKNNEIYTLETFYPRLNRGERTDAITIWDTATLQPKGEIVLPGGKRQQSLGYKNVFQFTNGEKWALVQNFTPGQSVRVVDLVHRKILNEIDLPGCAHVYPMGERGFMSLCADGSITSIALDEQGQVAASKAQPGVYDIDRQPMFNMPATIGKTAWFVTFYGKLKPFDLSGPAARPLKGDWSLGTAPGGEPEWRPSGFQVVTADARGLLYVVMTPHGVEGTHKDGGTEIWVYDPAKKLRVARFPLQGATMSIELTHEATPHIVAARADGTIDIYDAATGAFVRTLGGAVATMPITITAGGQ